MARIEAQVSIKTDMITLFFVKEQQGITLKLVQTILALKAFLHKTIFFKYPDVMQRCVQK